MTSFPHLHRAPDTVFVLAGDAPRPVSAQSTTSDRLVWQAEGVSLSLRPQSDQRMDILLESRSPLRRVFLRWKHTFASGTLLLGDAWERSYGDLEWRGVNPHRPMPWYFLASHDGHTAGYGVETGCASMACWRADADGVTLELDTRSGGVGVCLGSRILHAATLVQRLPQAEESPFEATRGLCQALCPKPLLPREPVVGHNDWYWLYGKNSETLILEATQRLLDTYPKATQVRPWSVIDDGWQASEEGFEGSCNGGPWDRGNEKFPDMAALAAKIKKLGVRPGIWMRPLLTKANVPESWKIRCPLLPSGAAGNQLDPSVPEVLDLVRADISRLRAWGYEMIKHDFSTFDATGRWGFQMNMEASGITPDGWAYADTTRTTAEILLNFYRVIREAAGPEGTLLGCNTVGHLAAGLVEVQRVGDDTSAREWDRTRRMGINTLAFRAAQQGTFFAVDADCVPVSPSIPEHLTAQWLDLVACSGTPLFLSIDPTACDTKQTELLEIALKNAVQEVPVGEPRDWLVSAVPSCWRLQGGAHGDTRYHWSEWDQ